MAKISWAWTAVVVWSIHLRFIGKASSKLLEQQPTLHSFLCQWNIRPILLLYESRQSRRRYNYQCDETFVTRSANLGASTTKEISPGSPDTFTQDLNFKDIGASSYITIRVCAIEIEGCYILIVTKNSKSLNLTVRITSFQFNWEDPSLLSLPAASHFTYSFKGTTGDADYIKFSGFGQRTVKAKFASPQWKLQDIAAKEHAWGKLLSILNLQILLACYHSRKLRLA